MFCRRYVLLMSSSSPLYWDGWARLPLLTSFFPLILWLKYQQQYVRANTPCSKTHFSGLTCPPFQLWLKISSVQCECKYTAVYHALFGWVPLLTYNLAIICENQCCLCVLVRNALAFLHKQCSVVLSFEL